MGIAVGMKVEAALPFEKGLGSLTGEPVVFTADEIHESLPEWFERMVEVRGDRPAVVTREETLSYRELNLAGNRLANRILAARENPEEGIALMAGHGATAIRGILGCVKSGKLYVTLDPTFPLERLQWITEHTGATLLVHDEAHAALAAQLAFRTGMTLLALEADDRARSEKNLDLRLPSDRPAYLFYTSGSTGRPKAAICTHRVRLSNQIDFMRRCQITADDRFSSLHSIAFAASGPEIYGALLSGAALYPFDVRAGGFDGLRAWIDRHEISIFQWVSSAFRKFATSILDGSTLESLRLILLGSEPVTTREIEQFRRVAGDNCLLVNRYGCTEGGNTHYFFMRKDIRLRRDVAPIGYPVSHKELLLLDGGGAPVPVGEVGEIHIRSGCISRGYWQDPERTTERFTFESGKICFRTGDLARIDPSGCWEHLGRMDQQIKIRGYRVEAAEVEAALARLDGLDDAAVTTTPDPHGELRLIAYVVPAPGARLSQESLRTSLRERLPDFMIPHRFIELPALPVTPTGKLYRAGLPQPEWEEREAQSGGKAPSDPLEAELLTIWSEVLDIKNLGVDDDFFLRGGDSLRAAQVVNRINSQLGISVSAIALWDHSTVETLAHLLSAKTPVPPSTKSMS